MTSDSTCGAFLPCLFRQLALSILVLASVARGQTPGSPDPLFDFTVPMPPLGEYEIIKAVALADGNQIVVASNFVVGSTLHNQVHRLNGDGSVDTSFPAAIADSSIASLSVDAEGKIVVCGEFNEINGSPCPGIARLKADGSIDPTFQPPTGPFAFFVGHVPDPEGGVILFGSFSSIGGTPRENVARLYPDGTLDPSFAPQIDDTVTAACTDSAGRAILGGFFTEVDGMSRNRIARLLPDGSLDESFDPGSGMNQYVEDVAVDHLDRVVACGPFTVVNGNSRDGVARLQRNGSVDTSFVPPVFDDRVRALAIDTSGRVLAGGYFTQVNGTAAPYLVRLNRDGSRDAYFDHGGHITTDVMELMMDIGGRVLFISAIPDGWHLGRLRGGESDSAPGINITFDYRYDTEGFFAGDNIGRRLVLEEVARVYESRLLDRLDPIDPVDTTPATAQGWRAAFFHPATDEPVIIGDLPIPANSLTVFPGASSTAFDIEVLARADAQYSVSEGSLEESDILSRGGGTATGGSANEYSGWGGSISFNANIDWFDSPPPGAVDPGKNDLYSTALHELAHLLGLSGGIPSWDARMVAHDAEKVVFSGSRVLAVQGSGNLVFVGLEDDNGQARIGGHFWAGTLSKVVGTSVVQEPVLSETLAPGLRRSLTELDLAALDDIGWDVTWPNTVDRTAAILKKIATVQAAIKKAKKSGKAAKVRALNKQLRALRRQLL